MEIKNLLTHKGRIVVSFLLILFLTCSQSSFGQYVLDLPGTAAPNNGYIKSSTALSLSGSFTIEAWVKIEGAGIISSTGSTAHSNIIPLVAKGRSIADGPDQQEVNYFVGYDATTRRLQADYEDFDASDNNHTGQANTTNGVLPNCKWVHIAVVCDLTSAAKQWLFYVDGVAAGTTAITWATTNDNPNSGSTAPAAIGSSHQINGTFGDDGPFGYFNGEIDEVRIWSVARTASQISTNYKNELTSGTNLVARFGMNDGAGTTVVNSTGASFNGTLTGGTLPLWILENQVGLNSVDFNGTDSYITFGAAPSLNTGTFTLEAWFRKEGTGPGASTGSSGGIIDVMPIVTKGRSFNDDPGNNVNYFMGISNATNQLAVDFEQTSVSGSALNNGFIGNTVIATNVWYHVAASYGAGAWKLYVNGVLDAQKTIAGAPVPEIISNMHAAIGSALLADGTPAGFFNGRIDEVRIWGVVRTQTEIQNNMYSPLYSGSGLLGRWGMNDICGTFNYLNSVRGGVSGTATGGYAHSTQNFSPVLTEGTPWPANGAIDHANENIQINRTDASAGTATFSLYARVQGSGNPFTLITSQAGVNAGAMVNFWWPNMQPLTTYEWYAQMTNGTSTLNGRVYTFTSSGIIPVRLLNFSATENHGQVQVKWATSNETNNKHFIVERSRDGKIFESVAQVNPQASQNAVVNYSIADQNPMTGISYYRLKQVDNDGRHAFSPVVRVQLLVTAKAGFDIYPNPVSSNIINVSFLHAVNGDVEVKVYDLAGRLQMLTRLGVANNALNIRHNLSKGVYILKIATPHSEMSKKIIIQ